MHHFSTLLLRKSPIHIAYTIKFIRKQTVQAPHPQAKEGSLYIYIAAHVFVLGFCGLSTIYRVPTGQSTEGFFIATLGIH